ncbi:LysM peptidoglycan-binding domain-containing protein [Falsochrobactrum sp. TDYN1]|uniref:LysM peptidoglycan-binding domain-containing protein n=1 Tax=Falsochrobactrum tianjinense TaxID=2706015 RepID=A0A949PPL5_9HYPH|nr:Ig-like domain-containing protein [Falsochrobactrum sp. TDYN1]MBV2142535.1 LysM peptidoglycan-binding domain-containing protein [Falsochrobactrum sp. TDYN1]
MQKYSYGLLGFLLVLVLGGGALYWSSLMPPAETPKPDAASVATPQQPVEEKPAEPQEPLASQQPVQAEAEPQNADAQAQAANEAPDTAIDTATGTATVPAFDILRVEPDGSVVIAGRAAPNADVDVVAGSKVLGTTTAGENGDFAVVLDRALKPGDHQLVLRASGAGANVATSSQTAIVSVPENSGGQVLALVEEPGQASRLITRPEGETQPAPAPATGAQTPLTPGAAEQAKPEPQASSVADIPIAIEAVEIEGQSVFVAGSAKGAKGDGNSVTVKANEILLGSSTVSPEGRFLVQSQKLLAVGDYIIRADLLDASGRVIATARVPFRRVAGENISAIASGVSGQAEEVQDPASPAALQKVEGSVIIRRGDNLWTISKRTYGKGTRYTTIYLANRDQIRNPDLIWPGQVFVMPQEPLPDAEVQRRLHESVN